MRILTAVGNPAPPRPDSRAAATSSSKSWLPRLVIVGIGPYVAACWRRVAPRLVCPASSASSALLSCTHMVVALVLAVVSRFIAARPACSGPDGHKRDGRQHECPGAHDARGAHVGTGRELQPASTPRRRPRARTRRPGGAATTGGCQCPTRGRATRPHRPARVRQPVHRAPGPVSAAASWMRLLITMASIMSNAMAPRLTHSGR